MQRLTLGALVDSVCWLSVSSGRATLPPETLSPCTLVAFFYSLGILFLLDNTCRQDRWPLCTHCGSNSDLRWLVVKFIWLLQDACCIESSRHARTNIPAPRTDSGSRPGSTCQIFPTCHSFHVPHYPSTVFYRAQQITLGAESERPAWCSIR